MHTVSARCGLHGGKRHAGDMSARMSHSLEQILRATTGEIHSVSGRKTDVEGTAEQHTGGQRLVVLPTREDARVPSVRMRLHSCSPAHAQVTLTVK